MAKNKLHTQYRVNNKRVPSVTAIIGTNLGWNKASLISWAKNTAKAGNDPDKVRDEAASIGTLTHEMVENHIKGLETNLFLSSASDIQTATLGYNAFLDWEMKNSPKYLESEVRLSSEELNYGGTIDLVIELDGQIGILDIKTSKNVYPDHIIQLSAYRQLYTENVQKVDFCAIIKLDKVNGGFEYHSISNERLDLAFEAFKHCLALHNLKKKV